METLLRVLIVEDSEDDAALVMRQLQRAGYDLITERVQTAEEMKTALDREAWDLVLSDYSMPNFDAPTALNLFHQSGLEIPFIIVSGSIGEDIAVTMMKAGAHDYVLKQNLARFIPAVQRELHDAENRRQARRIEQALHQSEQALGQALDAADIGHWNLDLVTLTASRSLRHDQIFGYEEMLPDWSFEKFLTHVHPEDRAQVEQLFTSGVAAKTEWEFECRIFRHDGALRWIWGHGHVFTDAAGEAVRMSGLVSDITERKRSIVLLSESNERFELANRATFDVIWDWDLKTKTIWRNENFQKLFGYSKEEVDPSTESSVSFLHPDDLVSVKASLDAALNGKNEFWADQYRCLRKDGSYATVEDRAIIFRDADGQAVRMLGAMQDISERVKAEQALGESELHYRTLFQANPNPMWVYELETLRFLAVNHAAVSHYGYSEAEFLAMTILDIRPPQDLPKLQASLNNSTGEGIRTSEIWRHLKRDGSIIDVEITSHSLDFGGRSARVVLANDITARLRAEAALRLQGAALEAAANAIIITDRQGLIEWANSAFTTFTGFSLPEAIGKKPGDLIRSGKHDAAFFKIMWDTILANRVWQGEIINKRKDGSLYTEEMTITPLKDERGEIAHFVAVKQDITQRVEAERELHEYTKRLEAMREIDAAILGARSTPELVQSTLARLRRIVPFDRAAVVLFDPGLTEGTFLAVDQREPWLPQAGEVRPIGDFHDLKELRSVPLLEIHDLRDIQRCILEELLFSQGLRSQVYFPMQSEGSMLGFLVISSITLDMLIPQYAEIVLDMTDQLVVAIQHSQLKEELEVSNLQLESKVEKRTEELRTTLDTMQVLEGVLRQREADAQAASEAKSTFLSSMSHELRTPLIGITGMLEILRESELDAEQRQVAGIIQQSSESLLNIIGDILDFSKIEANKLELAAQTFSARALLESVAQTFRPAISAKGLNFIVELDPRMAPAHVADMLRLRQILNNFLSNAVKFTENGSITLRSRLLEAHNNTESMAFEVQDTGIGVSQENLAKLFTPFAQAEASTARRFGGTGLGLIISRRLAELMGGRLTMQSTLGQGTTMTLAVDLAVGNMQDIVKTDRPDATKVVPMRPAPSIEVAEKERSLILMAEDHPTNRTVLTRQINRAGYALEVSVDGQEAFEKWQSGRYALILTDLHMPRMDGYQLTKSVRDWERAHGAPRTPILALTANALGGEAERCRELGMDDYLIKPVTIPLLASKLRQWMPHVRFSEATEATATPAQPASKNLEWMRPGINSKTLLDLCHGDVVVAQEIINGFIAATKTDLLVMQEGVQQKDESCVLRQSHRIKGSAAMVGAHDLTERATILEAYAQSKTPEWGTIQEQVAGIQEALKILEAVAE